MPIIEKNNSDISNQILELLKGSCYGQAENIIDIVKLKLKLVSLVTIVD